ncbi:MAG: hypothetical protein KGJ09_09645 [Candidatus Omnitrophica bacterium]|nr:hypothetical protein [Candidatus Omnitrophota bacterium]
MSQINDQVLLTLPSGRVLTGRIVALGLNDSDADIQIEGSCYIYRRVIEDATGRKGTYRHCPEVSDQDRLKDLAFLLRCNRHDDEAALVERVLKTWERQNGSS